MALKLSNNAVGFLAAALSPADTALALQPGQGSPFPVLAAGDWCPGTLIGASGTVEIVRVTARADDAFTVQRAQESTSAKAFNAGDRFELRLTAGTLGQAFDDVGPKVGDIKIWHGLVANISTVHGPGWQLADGTNGTADLRDRFVVGAGDQYAPGDTGGAATVVLAVDEMPVHNHAVTDPGHGHAVTDPKHAHTITDPGHQHDYVRYAGTSSGSSPSGGSGQQALFTDAMTSTVGTNVTINLAPTGISVQGAPTGITVQDAGAGAAHENMPPYYALAFIEYTGIGA